MRLERLLKAYSKCLITLDGLWFLAAERKLGLEEATSLDAEVWREYASRELERVAEAIGVEVESMSITSLADVAPYLPWLTLNDYVIEVSGSKLLLKVTYCRPQEARIRRGLKPFPCKPVGEAYFRALVECLKRPTEVKCLGCPPEKPAGAWCIWEISER